MQLSHTEENYLKAIYKLSNGGLINASTNDLSTALQNRAASVTDMLGKLSAKNLITYTKYRGVTLTQLGKGIALGVIRKHRLWECFLVQKLKFSWDEIHEMAEQLEHIQSERLIQRLEEFLGHPTQDPHGEPIPDAQGKLEVPRQVNVATALPGDKVKVSKVNEEETMLLQFLNEQSIGIGSVLNVLEVNGRDGSVRVRTPQRRKVLLSRDVARHIFVQHILR